MTGVLKSAMATINDSGLRAGTLVSSEKGVAELCADAHNGPRKALGLTAEQRSTLDYRNVARSEFVGNKKGSVKGHVIYKYEYEYENMRLSRMNSVRL